MKNRQLQNLHEGLKETSKLQGAKFAYAVAKNKKLIEDEVSALNEGITPAERYAEYDTKRVDLAKEHSKKDKKGAPVIKTSINGLKVSEEQLEGLSAQERASVVQEYDVKDMKKFEKELELLRVEYKEEIDARAKQLADYAKLMDEDSKIEFHKVKEENIPEDITGEQLERISEIIE